jgi:hypothetical protein
MEALVKWGTCASGSWVSAIARCMERIRGPPIRASALNLMLNQEIAQVAHLPHHIGVGS